MNITFLIGNGFDLNLRLATTYSEFVKFYKTTPPRTDNLKNFRSYIKENEELWSSAELALGAYTNQFEKGQAAAFSECHSDICLELSKYLKEQQARVDFNNYTKSVEAAFSRINTLSKPFPTQEQAVINGAYTKRNNEIRVFQFICFNYTNTLDESIKTIKNNADVLGSHKNGNQTLGHSIGAVCHVHGTVEKEMVFGVNDSTQIKKPEIFDCDYGDIYKNLLIKKNANASYQEDTDAKATKIIKDSHIIYIYGMSIGPTDKLWWQRICKWLDSNSDHHLIIQKHKMPTKGAFPLDYQVEEQKSRDQITQYGNFSAPRKMAIENQIHITADNIFEDIQNIAKLTDVEATALFIEEAEKYAKQKEIDERTAALEKAWNDALQHV